MMSTTHKIAVLTGSSTTGSACIRTLLELLSTEKRMHIQAGFRTEAKVQSFRDSLPLHLLARLESCDDEEDDDEGCGGAALATLETFSGCDAADPASIAAVFQGCDKALIVTPHDIAAGMDKDAEMTIAMIREARKAGVRHVVVVGSWTAPYANSCIQVIGSRFGPVEKALAQGAIGAGDGDAANDAGEFTYTVLRGGFFTPNFARMLGPSIRADDTVRFPDFEIPAVDPRDIGRVAAFILTDTNASAHAGETYEISGPERLTSQQVTEAISAGIGRPLAYEPISVEEASAKLPPFLAELFRAMGLDKNLIISNSCVERITGRPGTTVEEWSCEHMHLFEKEKQG